MRIQQNIFTVFLNLLKVKHTKEFSNPCARMHKRVVKLLRETKRKISIQYLFSFFNADLEFANKYLIASYLEKEQQEFERIISEWFGKGKRCESRFFAVWSWI